jgi:hypothetical protein
MAAGTALPKNSAQPAAEAASPGEAEWLLHQRLLHGTPLHSSGGGGGSIDEDGPPEFF